jgi:4-amino-4-deoxy-L-arabinose transferase-like glycosyltransferase
VIESLYGMTGRDGLPQVNKARRLDLLALGTCLLLALAFRLPGLTVFLTADEARSWFGRSIIFLDSLLAANWANTGPGGSVPYIENVSLSPAPGVTTMWTGAIGIVLEYLRQGAPGSLAQFLTKIPFDPVDPATFFSLRLPGVLVAAAAVGLSYWWARPWLGRGGAWLAAALIALDPFYLALSRVLGHDALVSTFMWLSLLTFLRAIYEPVDHPTRITSRTVFLILSGACAGLAFLSKYPALFMGAFVALTMLVVYLLQPMALRFPLPAPRLTSALTRWFRDIALWSIAAGLVVVFLWPVMWVDPLGPITTIMNDALRASGSAHQKGSFFLGQPVADPGALFYPLVILLRTTPVVFLGLLLSVWLLLRRRLSVKEVNPTLLRTSLILLAYIVLYTLLVTYGGKKQDRYILPAFPSIVMLASMGYTHLLSSLPAPRSSLSAPRSPLPAPRSPLLALRSPLLAPRSPLSALRLSWIIPLALILLQIVFIFPYYPYYFTYYNPFAGGGQVAAKTLQVGWGEGLNEAAAYLNSLPGVESTQVTSWYSTTFEPYYHGQAIYKLEDEKISRNSKPGLAADYVIFYINQTQRQLPSEGALQYFQATTPVYTVTLNGLDYAWIYPSVGMQNVLAGDVRLVGQAELLGYNLTSEAGQPVESAYPESVVFLSLFWEWQGKSNDDPIRLSLIDAAGKTRGWGNPIETVAPLPFDEWQTGMVVRDEFALVIFPDTPPGEYRLSVWIERPATNETVGVFPLDGEAIIPVVPRLQ